MWYNVSHSQEARNRPSRKGNLEMKNLKSLIQEHRPIGGGAALQNIRIRKVSNGSANGQVRIAIPARFMEGVDVNGRVDILFDDMKEIIEIKAPASSSKMTTYKLSGSNKSKHAAKVLTISYVEHYPFLFKGTKAKAAPVDVDEAKITIGKNKISFPVPDSLKGDRPKS